MNTLLKKELRIVLPASVAAIGLACITAPWGFGADKGVILNAVMFAGAAGIAALGYGQELQYQTLDLQLTLPVSKRRLWWIKLIALFAGVFPLLLILAAAHRWIPQFAANTTNEFEPYALWTALACLGTTLFTWKLRSIIGGAAVGGLAALVWFGLAEPTLWAKVVARTSKDFTDSSTGHWIRWLGSAGLVGLTALVHYRSWMGGENRGRQSSEEGIHNWSLALVGTRPNRSTPLWNLIVKEARLQTPAIFVAIVCSAFTLIAFAGRGLLPDSLAALEAYKAGIGVLIAIVPLLVGCTTFAEERSLRSLQPAVTIPRAWSTMFTAKTVSSCGLAMLLAVALPLMLEAITPSSELNPVTLSIVVLSVWTISLLASSISTGTVRAAIVTVVIASLMFATWIIWIPLLAAGITIGAGGLTNWIRIMFPQLLLGNQGDRIIVVFLSCLYAVLAAGLMLSLASKMGRKPDVTRKQMVTTVALILAATAPLAGLILECADNVGRLIR